MMSREDVIAQKYHTLWFEVFQSNHGMLDPDVFWELCFVRLSRGK